MLLILALPILGASLALAPRAHGQQMMSEKDLTEIRRAAYDGCLTKQQADPLNANLTPAFVKTACECVADDVTKQSLASMDIQVAFAKKEWTKLESLIATMFGPENLARLARRCIEVNGGIKKGLDVSNSSKSAPSQKIGLTGESRRSFVVSAVAECTDGFQKDLSSTSVKPQSIRRYCECGSTYVADHISEAHLLRFIREKDGAAANEVATLNDAAAKTCISKLLE